MPFWCSAIIGVSGMGVRLSRAAASAQAFGGGSAGAGSGDEALGAGAARSTLDELTTWTQWADKVLVF